MFLEHFETNMGKSVKILVFTQTSDVFDQNIHIFRFQTALVFWFVNKIKMMLFNTILLHNISYGQRGGRMVEI